MTVPSSLADACQSPAHHPGDLPAVLPHTVTPAGTGSLHAVYECPHCGRGWVVCWDARAAGWPVQQDGGPPPSRARSSAARTARLEDYAELRAWGLTLEAAAERLGVSSRTAWRYEAALREQEAA